MSDLSESARLVMIRGWKSNTPEARVASAGRGEGV